MTDPEHEPSATEARKQAEEQLEAVRGRGPHVRQWAEQWARLYERNGFMEMIREAFQQ